MPIVYVIQESPGKNLLPAADYGEVKVLLPPDRQVTCSAGAVAQELMGLLSDFSNDDFLVLVGDPVAIGVACACAAHWNQGRFKALKWDRQQSRYWPVAVDLYQGRKE